MNNDEKDNKERVKCKRCGKWLTVEKSIERGYGPVCWEKIHRKYGSLDEYLETKKAKDSDEDTTEDTEEEKKKKQKDLDEVFLNE